MGFGPSSPGWKREGQLHARHLAASWTSKRGKQQPRPRQGQPLTHVFSIAASPSTQRVPTRGRTERIRRRGSSSPSPPPHHPKRQRTGSLSGASTPRPIADEEANDSGTDGDDEGSVYDEAGDDMLDDLDESDNDAEDGLCDTADVSDIATDGDDDGSVYDEVGDDILDDLEIRDESDKDAEDGLVDIADVSDSEDDENEEDERPDSDEAEAEFIAWAQPASIAAGPLDKTPDNIAERRGETRILGILGGFVQQCQRVGTVDDFDELSPSQRPVTRRWFECLAKALAADGTKALGQRLVQAVPRPVLRILGQEQITADHLTQLPRIGLDSKELGCYLSAATASAGSQVKDKQHQYVGSAIGYRGLVSRMRSHFAAIRRARAGKVPYLTRHYRFAARFDVKSEFFILAQRPPSTEAAETLFLLEGIFQVFFNVVAPTARVLKFHSPAVTAFIDNTRAMVPGLPDLSLTGLNSAFALRQGGNSNMLNPNATTAGCQNPACRLPFRERFRFYGSDADKRCDACDQYQRKHGIDRPADVIERGRRNTLAHESHLAGEGCQNLSCLEPFNGIHGNFHGSGSDRRCNACYQHLDRTGGERPASVVAAYRANKAREGCKNPSCLADWTQSEKFYEVEEERRCRACYKYRLRKRTDRSADVVAAHRERALVIAANKAREGCKNPDCQQEFDGKMVFRGHGDARRCRRCYEKAKRKSKRKSKQK